MGILNRYSIDNGDVEVHASKYPFESTYESGPDPDNNIIKLFNDDEMDHLLEFFRSKHDGYLLGVYLQLFHN